ncbi:hypothetical protein 2F1_33 [Uncultured Caudovirales phage clone 2F_1]|uniref:Phage tail protein n=1 Tax=Uncultured Caudovirales phage clone 2F_1 TaxID=2992576 RepID=A0A2H4J8N7_9CAUD|nr:phage tail protein [Acinetobacter radioresistens]YP_010092461.1 hypothetical protein KNT73_gp33 [Uncultured Caudovirales phage clone 2F_1]ASN71634.1 hypothetical protein 2F1_33 [Uncultured Caudovirales phage clone 2F_1]RJL74431.1 hypothetical protein D5055_02845 [Acinetobacter radioresistens]
MKALIPLKSYLSEKIPTLSADKCHLLIVNGTQAKGYLEYTARLLFLDFRGDPIEVIMLIRNWLKAHNLNLDSTGQDVLLSFSSEVIDTDTFDLEIDFPQRDKVVMNENGPHICPQMVWSDKHGKFIPAGSE